MPPKGSKKSAKTAAKGVTKSAAKGAAKSSAKRVAKSAARSSGTSSAKTGASTPATTVTPPIAKTAAPTVAKTATKLGAKIAGKVAVQAELQPPTPPHPSTRNGGHAPSKRRAAPDWEDLKEQGKKRKRSVDEAWRRRDSVTHLVASVYADIEAAAELQRRAAGTGSPLTGEERSALESSEDVRLDYLRELRLAEILASPKALRTLKAAPMTRGKRFFSLRAARDIMSSMAPAQRTLLADVVENLGWPLLAVCLHSPNFRTRFLDVRAAGDLDERMEQLLDHALGIEFFAKSRFFNRLEQTAEQQEQDVLFRDLHCLLTDAVVPQSREISKDEVKHARLWVETPLYGFPEDDARQDHPHEWELSSDGEIARRLDFLPGGEAASRRLQVNIEESEILYQGQKWTDRGGRPLLGFEPRYRTQLDDDCAACEDDGIVKCKKWRADCDCSFENLKIRRSAEREYFGSRIELRITHPIVGTGVIALQYLPAGSLLAEYVGEIYPFNQGNQQGLYQNSTYLYAQNRRTTKGKAKNAIYIDPSVRGNWTRYINHSCRPKTKFTSYTCGDKILTCIRVGDGPIEFGQEITVSYGKQYFIEQNMACRCGVDECKLWNADRVQNNKITLHKARMQGIAPAWAN